ncbi:MAG: undecaprenyldiphospho-muramoylpentapeptide beta-N-acetylglucosaminyltransferase [Bacteroidetes bacterium]|nr:undecaprenyldiphospho-muramoylpentapeptide beta-N-acetylglucosaminyltransferase [Bacteroidota bacterium]
MQKREARYKIIISGGGTGGHIFPAIAIADTFRELVPSAEILFVGASDRMEMQKIPEAGYEIIGLWISGFQRKLSFKNLLVPFKVLSSIQKSKSVIRKFKPDAVVGVGGYASGPLLYVASSRNIPTLIQEQNSYAGITNKILRKRVDKICVAYEKMERFFPAEKLIMTGNPVRTDIRNLEEKREEALQAFNLDPDKKVILVIGGSLGARTINETLIKNISKLLDEGLQILWQTGVSQFEMIKEKTGDLQGVVVTAFIKKMHLAYAAADLVVSRAGALAISELCIVRKPSILVPSPFVVEDHQTKNAYALVEKKAAILVADKNLEQQLVPEILRLIGDEEKMNTLKNNIGQLAKPDASQRIAEEIIKMIESH